MEPQEPENRPTLPDWFKSSLPIFFVGLLLAFLLFCYFPQKKKQAKTRRTRKREELFPKSQLVKLYRVNKRTVNKWVEAFCIPVAPSLKNYPYVRKLSVAQKGHIFELLGDPDEFPVLGKSDIIDRCESDYKTLRMSIRKFPEKFGISGEDFARLSAFPPKVGQRILQQMQ